MKKAKVTKITKMEKKDSYGNTTFIIELDNGDKGFYTSKQEDQRKFWPGEQAEYLIEEKIGKTNNKYFKITVPQPEGGFQKGGRPQVEPRIQMISFAMAYTKDLIVAGKIGMQDLEKEFSRIYKTMISVI